MNIVKILKSIEEIGQNYLVITDFESFIENKIYFLKKRNAYLLFHTPKSSSNPFNLTTFPLKRDVEELYIYNLKKITLEIDKIVYFSVKKDRNVKTIISDKKREKIFLLEYSSKTTEAIILITSFLLNNPSIRTKTQSIKQLIEISRDYSIKFITDLDKKKLYKKELINKQLSNHSKKIILLTCVNLINKKKLKLKKADFLNEIQENLEFLHITDFNKMYKYISENLIKGYTELNILSIDEMENVEITEVNVLQQIRNDSLLKALVRKYNNR